MNVYEYTDYKKVIKDDLKSEAAKKKFLNLKKLSVFLDIQYTFLSKCLNSDKSHLNEDHLYRACDYLNFTEDEKDYLLLLRQKDVSQNGQRREFLIKKIEKIRTSRNLQGDMKDQNSKNIATEFELLVEPLCDLVFLGLQIPEIRKDPRKLVSMYGITLEKLRIVLDILEKNQMLIRDSEFEIKKSQRSVIHRPRTHPLVQAHQQLLKSQLQQKLLVFPESSKESYIFSFSGNAKTFEKIKKEFQQFVKKIQEETLMEKPTEVFQMSFDLLKWT